MVSNSFTSLIHVNMFTETNLYLQKILIIRTHKLCEASCVGYLESTVQMHILTLYSDIFNWIV